MKKIPKQLLQRKNEIIRLQQKAYDEFDTKLSKTYKDALDGILEQLQSWVDDYEQMTFSQRREFDRKLQSAEAISGLLANVSKDASEQMNGFLVDTGKRQYSGAFYQLDTTYGLNLNNFTPDLELVQKLVNKPVNGKRFSQRLDRDVDKLVKRTNQSILNSLWNGDSYDKIAGHVQLLNDTTYKQAQRIARTEMGRITDDMTHRAYQEVEKQGVNIQKRWLATLDRRTRSDHRVLDGQTVGIDDEFKLGDSHAMMPHHFGIAGEDINCRCTTISIVDGIEPKKRRDNETGEATKAKDYQEWLDR